MDSVRIDKWLWAARFFKTRSAATDAVVGGHVRVAGNRVKPSRELRVGEQVEIVQGRARRTVIVADLADRRGPAAVAATLYEETAESLEAREELRLERQLTQPIFGARPTKLERRRLEALRKAAERRR